MEDITKEYLESLSTEEQEKLFEKMLNEQMNTQVDLTKLNLSPNVAEIMDELEDINVSNGEITIKNNRKNRRSNTLTERYVDNSYDYDDQDEDDRFNRKIDEYEKQILSLRKEIERKENKKEKLTDKEINESFKNINLREVVESQVKDIDSSQLVTLDDMSYEEIKNSKLPSFIKETLLEKIKSQPPKKVSKPSKPLNKEIIPLHERISSNNNTINEEKIKEIISKLISENNKKMLGVISKVVNENNKKMKTLIEQTVIKQTNKMLLEVLTKK